MERAAVARPAPVAVGVAADAPPEPNSRAPFKGTRYETMTAVRCLVVLLAVTLSGPSVGALLCDLACAVQHADSVVAAGNCHEQGADTTTTAVASGHECHALATAPESVLTKAPHATVGALAVADVWLASAAPAARDRAVEHPHNTSHAPPPSLIPLRV